MSGRPRSQAAFSAGPYLKKASTASRHTTPPCSQAARWGGFQPAGDAVGCRRDAKQHHKHGRHGQQIEHPAGRKQKARLDFMRQMQIERRHHRQERQKSRRWKAPWMHLLVIQNLRETTSPAKIADRHFIIAQLHANVEIIPCLAGSVKKNLCAAEKTGAEALRPAPVPDLSARSPDKRNPVVVGMMKKCPSVLRVAGIRLPLSS